ncbi:unnamed protein product [Phytophthora fragariaefolia]|uniref:Unnamed protein product n=1 Tax=Phytophthora fragariaefolia TaxID=1490495 RepID=A0A9W6XZ78_9STRA|nr:unnamed protein product [Phytophthora fragariaefolia]
MVSLLGEAAFAGFPNLSAEQQKARVERFDKFESSRIAHVSAAAQEAARAAMRAEVQSAAQASATNSASFAARPTTTKPVKMSIPTFDAKDSDSLVFWVREIEIALSAGQIYDARAQVAFALSNLGGRARAWTMARTTATPGYFTSWSFMEQELRSTFLLANVAYRHRSNLLRCKAPKALAYNALFLATLAFVAKLNDAPESIWTVIGSGYPSTLAVTTTRLDRAAATERHRSVVSGTCSFGEVDEGLTFLVEEQSLPAGSPVPTGSRRLPTLSPRGY